MDKAEKQAIRLQLATMPVAHIMSQIAVEQEHCQLLQEELYSRAQLHAVSVQQWRVFRRDAQVLLDLLQAVQEGETVGKALLDRRDAALQLLDRYLDGSPLPEAQQEATSGKRIHEPYVQHLASVEQVKALVASLAQAQTACSLLAEKLSAQAALQSRSVQHWHAFQRTMQPFLQFLRGLHGGAIVDDELLQHRDVFLSTLESYLDELPAKASEA